MALSFDVAASGSASAASSLTYPHTVGAGSNPVICVQPTLLDAIAGSATISSVTYATIALSLVTGSSVAFTLGGAFDAVVASYVLVAPATGANNVVVTASEACDTIYTGSQSWFGADQTTPTSNGTTNTAGTGQPLVTVSSATGNQVLAHCLAAQTLADGLESSEIERWDSGGGAGAAARVGASQDGAASVTMDWTGATGINEWGASGFSLIAAGAAAQMAGTGIAILDGASLASAAFNASGQATMVMQGSALAVGALSAAGLSTVEWLGASVAEGSGAFQTGGASTVEWIGQSTSGATFSLDGTGDASFVGLGGAAPEPEPTPRAVPPGSGGTWAHPSRLKARRKKQLQHEDEELIAILRQAAPYLMQGRRILH